MHFFFLLDKILITNVSKFVWEGVSVLCLTYIEKMKLYRFSRILDEKNGVIWLFWELF